MCDQTMPYTPGMFVWVKLVDRIWWPGKVVEPSSIPNELESYKNKKRNPIATVRFSREPSFEIVTNMDKISLYSCAKKMEFLEKGYSLYLRQMKRSGILVSGFDMDIFIQDVVDIENEIGGDPNIFKQFTKKEDTPKSTVNIKELFMSEKERRKRKKSSFESIKIPVKKPIIKRRSTPLQSAVNVGGFFPCPHCSFKARLYDVWKIHISTHKNVNNDSKNEETTTNHKSLLTPSTSKRSTSTNRASTSKSFSFTPKKRNVKTKKTDNKKVKIQDELLKDWDDEDIEENISLDQDESLEQNTSVVKNEASKENSVQSQYETLDKDEALGNGDTVQDNDDTDLDNDNTIQDKEVSAQDDLCPTKNTIEVLTTDKKEVKLNSPTRIFDFDENADNELHESFQNHSNQESLSKSWASVTNIQDHDNTAQEFSTNNISSDMSNSGVFQNELTNDVSCNNDGVLEVVKSNDESMTENLDKPLWLNNSERQSDYDEVVCPVVSPNEITKFGEDMNLEVKYSDSTADVRNVMVRNVLPSSAPDQWLVVKNLELYCGDPPPHPTDEELENNENFQTIKKMLSEGGQLHVEILGPFFYTQ